MKICDQCGELNFNIKIVDKKEICHHCNKSMSSSNQCKPTRNTEFGQPKEGMTSKLKTDYGSIEEI